MSNNEIGVIDIRKRDGKFHLNIIAYDEMAEKLDISDGLWTDIELSESLFDEFLSVITAKADYTKDRGRELEFMTTINGTLWKDMTVIG